MNTAKDSSVIPLEKGVLTLENVALAIDRHEQGFCKKWPLKSRLQLLHKLYKEENSKYDAAEMTRKLLDLDDVNNIEPQSMFIDDSSRDSLVHIACKYGHKDVISLLLNEAGIPAWTVNANGQTALHFAVLGAEENLISEETALDCVKVLTTQLQILDMLDESRQSALTLAINNKLWTIVDHLISIEAYVFPSQENIIKERNPKVIMNNTEPYKFILTQLFNENDENEIVRNLEQFLTPLSTYDDDTDDFILKEQFYDLLAYTMKQNMLTAVEKLLQLNAQKYMGLAHDKTGTTPVHEAITLQNLDCLKLLLKYKCDMKLSKFGRYPLHLAVENRNIGCVKLLLADEYTNINARTNQYPFLTNISIDDYTKDTALHIALKTNQSQMVKLLLENGADLFLEDADGCAAFTYMSPSELYAYFNTKITGDNESYCFDFSFLLEQYLTVQGCCGSIKSKYNEMNHLKLLASSKKHRPVLSHPLIKYYLYLQWKRYWLIFFSSIFIYVIFTIFVTFLIYHQTFTVVNNESTGYEVPTILCIVILIVREIGELAHSIYEYTHNPKNYLELTILALTIYILVEVNIAVSALLIILIYMEFILMIGRHPILETNINILLRVAKNATFFILWYSPVILAFSFSFYMLMHSSQDKSFGNFSKTTFKTFVMLSGEYDASDLVLEKFIVQFIFILFVFLVVIIFMNLLNALAVGDANSVRNKAEISKYVTRVWLLHQMEMASNGFLFRTFRMIRSLCCPKCKPCICFEDLEANKRKIKEGTLIVKQPRYVSEVSCIHASEIKRCDLLQTNLSFKDIMKETKDLLLRKSSLSTEDRLENMETVLSQLQPLAATFKTLLPENIEHRKLLENVDNNINAMTKLNTEQHLECKDCCLLNQKLLNEIILKLQPMQFEFQNENKIINKRLDTLELNMNKISKNIQILADFVSSAKSDSLNQK